jgi:hypothetical protein
MSAKEVIGLEFSRVELFGVHRPTVDAHSLQHPDQYMKSTKSGAGASASHAQAGAWVSALVGEQPGDPR